MPIPELLGKEQAQHIGKDRKEKSQDAQEMTACHDVTGIDDVSRLGKGKDAAPDKKAVGRSETAYGGHDEKKGIRIPPQSYRKTASSPCCF